MKDEHLIETKENNKDVKENKETTENFTTEIFREFKKQSRFTTICLTVLLIIGTLLYYKNDYDWRQLFNSYDFVSQDGEGINNVNSGSQGDLNNSPE